MNPNFRILFSYAIILTLSCYTGAVIRVTINPLTGYWDLKEVHWISPDTTVSINRAQPGLFLFTRDSYSMMWTPLDQKRESFRDLSAPTESEIRSGFSSIVFNAGRYKISDSTLTTTAQVAKVNGFEGGKQFFQYTIQQDSLVPRLVDEQYPNEEKPQWSGIWETMFVLGRMDPDHHQPEAPH